MSMNEKIPITHMKTQAPTPRIPPLGEPAFCPCPTLLPALGQRVCQPGCHLGPTVSAHRKRCSTQREDLVPPDVHLPNSSVCSRFVSKKDSSLMGKPILLGF